MSDNYLITDNLGNTIFDSISKNELIEGKSVILDDNVIFLNISSLSNNCCGNSKKIKITEVTNQQLADWQYSTVNNSSIWEHLTDTSLYNSFYGCINPYIIEYPFNYQFQDEITQSIQDYTKVYKYTSSTGDVNRKVQTDDYFNKAILYNDRQSSGLLELVKKPKNNLSAYMSYPIYRENSKSILYTKSDNLYQYNTFWSVVKDPLNPLFISSCKSLSIDKEINNDNMDYSTRTYKKSKLRAKDLRVRMILDNRSDIHLVSQILITSSQISYK